MAAGMSGKAHRTRARKQAAGGGAGRADGYVCLQLGNGVASWLFVADAKGQH